MAIREIVLKLDETDAEAVEYCMSLRRGSSLPDTDDDNANLDGRVIAEICRGWAEMLGEWPPAHNTPVKEPS